MIASHRLRRLTSWQNWGKNKAKGRGGGGNNWSTERKSYAEVPKVNEQFERLYNDLNIVPEGEEREQFWAALRRELPNSFRFCGSKGYLYQAPSEVAKRLSLTFR